MKQQIQTLQSILWGLLLVIFGTSAAFAQIEEPVTWSFESQKVSETEYNVVMKATIEKGWHVYSQDLGGADEGPLPTEFLFDPTDEIEWVGGVTENKDKMHTEFDPNFKMDLNFYDLEAVFTQKVKITAPGAFTGVLSYMVCNDEKCLPPEDVDINIQVGGPNNGKNLGPKPEDIDKKPIVEETPTEPIDTEEEEPSGLLGIFVLGFLGGFVAIFTPCVFPMIPLTVSFFTKQSPTRAIGIRNAIIYGLSIIAIYTSLGAILTLTLGVDAMYDLATNVYFNLFLFGVLFTFGLSFLGAFELTLPSALVNSSDKASNKGGLVGIFFMALTLGLVSFSCTGPIIGGLLAEMATSGSVAGPMMGMLGFSTALALPFTLFAMFPSWMTGLPRSGGWLNSVKVSLGLLEIAFAFKFLSNADLVTQSHLLPRELFIAVWIGIFGSLGLYLLGFIRFSHDSPVTSLSTGRFLAGLTSVVFTIYMIPGLWGAPLKIISGFPPPLSYSESPRGIGQGGGGSNSSNVNEDSHCPFGLDCFHDYDAGVAYAKEVGKPILVDFTGWSCANCRRMEENTWSDPRVMKILRNEVVLISLYVDENTALPKEEHKDVMIGTKKKKIRTVGDKWMYLSVSRYETNSQPYYVILDHNEKQLKSKGVGYTNTENFLKWLKSGISKFKK